MSVDIYKLTAISPINPNSAIQPDNPRLAEYLDFEDRESYLAWRQEWRRLYSELSDQIRTLRKEWRAEGSNHDLQRHNALLRSRATARTMLALRKASKVKAEAAYQRSKEALVV